MHFKLAFSYFLFCTVSIVQSRKSTNHAHRLQGSSELDTKSSAANVTHWERLLQQVPSVVSHLRQMILLTNTADVSLEESRPANGWHFLQHPQSLRATMLQIGHEAWNTFRLTHRNMDEFQMILALIPSHINSAESVVKEMNPRSIKKLLPNTLEQIIGAANKCETLVNGTEGAFINLLGITEEFETAVRVALEQINIEHWEMVTAKYDSKRYEVIEAEVIVSGSELNKSITLQNLNNVKAACLQILQNRNVSFLQKCQEEQKRKQKLLGDAEIRLRNSKDRLDKLQRELAELLKEVTDNAQLSKAVLIIKSVNNLHTNVTLWLKQMKEQWKFLITNIRFIANRTTMVNKKVSKSFLGDNFILTQEHRIEILNHISHLSVSIDSTRLFLRNIAQMYLNITRHQVLDQLAGLSELLSSEIETGRNRLVEQYQQNAEEPRGRTMRFANKLHAGAENSERIAHSIQQPSRHSASEDHIKFASLGSAMKKAITSNFDLDIF